MMNEHNHVEWIDRYLNNELSAEELAVFQARLSTDSDFAAEVNEYIRINKGFAALELEHLHEQFAEWEKEENATTSHLRVEYKAETAQASSGVPIWRMSSGVPIWKMSSGVPIWKMSAAAGVAIVLAFSLWLFGHQTSHSPEQLYGSYYQVASCDIGERSISQEQDPKKVLLQEGATQFKQQNYQAAVETFTRHLALSTSFDTDAALYYRALSFVELNQLDRAERDLNLIAQDHSSAYSEGAHWYLALIALKSNQVEKAKSLLNELQSAASEADIRDKATQLLGDL